MNTLSLYFLYLIGNWYFASYESLAYKYILSVSGSLFIKLSNAFVFPDPEPPTTNIVYGLLGISSHFESCFLISSFVI